MKAKQMFENLGFIRVSNDNYEIRYRAESKLHIVFYLEDNVVSFINLDSSDLSGFKLDENLYKAISTQINELGWYSET